MCFVVDVARWGPYNRRMRSARFPFVPLGIVLSSACLSACGGAPTPVATGGEAGPDKQKLQVADSKSDGSAPAPVAVDLTPVAEPSIVGFMRWKSPANTLSNLSGCAGVSPQLIEGGIKAALKDMLRDMVSDAVDTSELANIVALDAPIDGIVALDASGKRRDPLGAMAVGLTSLERAKAALEDRERGALVEIASGMWRVGDGEPRGTSCALAAAAGGAPARLICAEREREVVALGPYLARNAPVATFAGNDLHGEIRFKPLVEQYGSDLRQQLKGLPILMTSQLSMGEPKFDKALGEAAAGLQTELTALIGDLDKVNLDIGVNPGTCLTGSGSLELRGKASWLAGGITEGAAKAGPPPAMFWQLPKDSDVASYGRGADPARYDAILQTLRALAEGAMAKVNIGNPADRKALAGLLTMRLNKDTSVVQAMGHSEAPLTGGKSGQAQQAVDSLMRGWLGWTLMGMDEGPEAITKSLKDLVSVYTRQAALAVDFEKRRGDKKQPPLSALTPVLQEVDFEAAHLPTMKVVPAPSQLGKGSMAIEVKFAGLPSPMEDMAVLGPTGGKKAGKPETIDFVMHILVMADGKTTWTALGSDKNELVKRLLMVKGTAPATDKLSARSSLETLKNGKFVSGGFMTISPLTRAAAAGVNFAVGIMGGGSSPPPEIEEMMRVLNALPHRGEAPIFFTTEATAGAAPRGMISFSVSQGVLEDIGAVFTAGIKVLARINP